MLHGGITSPRNKAILNMFNYIGVGERAGSGVPNIYDIWEKENYQEPTVEELSGREGTICTVVTLPLVEKDHLLSQKGDKKGDKKAMKKEDEIKARADAALKAITANPQITVNELASALSVSRKQTENALKRLKESGRIHREGSARNGKWIIGEERIPMESDHSRDGKG